MCIKPFYHTKYKVTCPCGGCVGCRRDKSLLWSNRCLYEMRQGRNAFVTLTYDTEHLHFNDGALMSTLDKKDIYDFLDNLRVNVKRRDFLPFGNRPDYRYYLVGEYGGRFQRPHYHVLFFGLDFSDFDKYFANLWRFGSVKSEPLNSATINYCVDYLHKSVNGAYAKEQFDDNNILRPFRSNSKNFGLGLFLAHQDEINKTGFIKIAGKYLPIPTYYKNMLCKYDKDSVASRADFARSMYHAFTIEAAKADKSPQEYRNFLRNVKFKSVRSRGLMRGEPVDNVYNPIYDDDYNYAQNYVADLLD